MFTLSFSVNFRIYEDKSIMILSSFYIYESWFMKSLFDSSYLCLFEKSFSFSLDDFSFTYVKLD
jgi:hypothetical protein